MANANHTPVTLAPIPLSAGEVRRWVGSDFCSVKFKNENQAPHEEDTYCMTAHDIISAFVNMGEIWPIAKLVIGNGKVTAASHLYAPGLPDGEHDVYPAPMMSDAEAIERNAENAEREQCAKIAESMEDVAGAIVHDIARAIRNGGSR